MDGSHNLIILFMKFSLWSIAILQLLSIGINAQFQSVQKVEIADGTKIPFGTPVYSTEASIVGSKVKDAKADVPKIAGRLCSDNDHFHILDSVEGNFSADKLRSKAYLYTDCSSSSRQIIQGVIVISDTTTISQTSYPYRADVKLNRIADLDGNGIDEIAIFSYEKSDVGFQTYVRILELGSYGLKKLGSLELRNDQNILFARKLSASYGSQGEFYVTDLKTDGSKWQSVGQDRRISLDVDATTYVEGKGRGGILRHLWVWTFLLQLLGFGAVIGFVVYELIASVRESDEEKLTKESRKAGKDPPIKEDLLPKLDPINCENCGAGLALTDAEMICTHCGARTTAPSDYFDIAQKRSDINDKIRSAATYVKRASLLSSNWVRYFTLLFALWVIVAMVAVVFSFGKGDLEPYLSILSSKLIFGFGIFSSCFWVVSLFLGFMVWGPRLRAILPVIEVPARFGEAEEEHCPQCGGAIRYAPEDLATVCRYCGVETYRAKLAWKLRDLTNQADTMANFSLIEAQKSVEDAIWDITGTPRTFTFLLLLVAILGGVVWLTGSVYDKLPGPLQDLLEFVSDILGAF